MSFIFTQVKTALKGAELTGRPQGHWMTFFDLAEGGGEDTSKDCFGGVGVDEGLSVARARVVAAASRCAVERSTLLPAV